jgi:D-cysteine desulfhydrase
MRKKETRDLKLVLSDKERVYYVSEETRPIFTRFPELREDLPFHSIAKLPTPIERIDDFGKTIGIEELYIKRDDLTAAHYGGNKVRKLEFLIGEALRQGAREVMTFGCAGSNHATATALYAKEAGLRSISMLLPQPNARSVRKNLLLSFHCGAELHMYKTSRALSLGVLYIQTRQRLTTGHKPYIIPAGGSSPLGVVGYVNAAFELREQIEKGFAPEPTRIYVAAGTTGTAAGLLLGFRAAGLKTKVIPVRVTGESFVNEPRIISLIEKTNALLRDADPSFPLCEFKPGDIQIRHDCYGEQYALYTEQSVEAANLMKETQGIPLEGTYTGKALAALIADARSGALEGETAMFWNTYNSRDVSGEIANVDYHQLPKAFHLYFEEEVQPLDRI